MRLRARYDGAAFFASKKLIQFNFFYLQSELDVPLPRVVKTVRLGAHWCDFQRHVALFNSLFYYIKAHIFDKNRHFLRKKSKMCAFEFRIFNHPEYGHQHFRIMRIMKCAEQRSKLCGN